MFLEEMCPECKSIREVLIVSRADKEHVCTVCGCRISKKDNSLCEC